MDRSETQQKLAKRWGVDPAWLADLEARASEIKDKPFVPTPDPRAPKPVALADDLDETQLV